jgi:hypothetical protein
MYRDVSTHAQLYYFVAGQVYPKMLLRIVKFFLIQVCEIETRPQNLISNTPPASLLTEIQNQAHHQHTDISCDL